MDRHTGVIESGMWSKAPQKPRGHARIKTTMKRHVHVTEDFIPEEVLQFEQNRQIKNGTVSATMNRRNH